MTGMESPGEAAPTFNEAMGLGLIAMLRDAEAAFERIWDMGQTGGSQRDVAMIGLDRVRKVIGILEQVKE